MRMTRKNRIQRAGLLIAFFSAITFITLETAFADLAGRAGRSGAGAASCASAGCHVATPGAVLPTLSFTGPTSLVAGAVGNFTVTVSGLPGLTAGIDIAARLSGVSAGVFTVTDAATKLSAAGNEVIHSAPKTMVANSATFTFDWTAPSTPGTATLFAAGVSSNGDLLETGDELALAQYVVTITPAAPAPNLPPIAVINAPAAPATGVAGTAINFDATGSNDPDGAAGTLQYSWDFGDGTPVVAGLMASHTFAAAGSYIVSLAVTDSAAATTLTTLPITISAAGTPAAPIAVITGGPTLTGTVGTALMLSGALSSDPDGTIVSYAWNLGDGTTSGVASPSVTYATAGAFAITLTVTDNAGLTGTATATANISAPANVTPAAGQTLFDDNCSGCHGPAGVGVAGGAPNIVGESAEDILEAFAEYPVHTGVAALTPAEVQEIATYLAIDTAAGAALFAANCESCHGAAGVGTATAPNIVGESAEDILEAFAEYAVHVDVAAALTEAQVQDIANYLEVLEESQSVEDASRNTGTLTKRTPSSSSALTSDGTAVAGALDWMILLIPGAWLTARRRLRRKT